MSSTANDREPIQDCHTSPPIRAAQEASEMVKSHTGTWETPVATRNTRAEATQETRRARTLVMRGMW
jgi:hypothetical protein